MINIDWDEVPGQPPKVSTVHGWLAKWRGTFLGNERLRRRGMREMKEASAIRAYKRAKEAIREASVIKGFSFFSTHKDPPSPSKSRYSTMSPPRATQRPHPRPTYGTHQVHNSPARSPYQRRGTSSRQHSYNSHHSGTRSRPRRR